MPTYRLQPARTTKYFLLLCVVVAVATAAPSAVVAQLSNGEKPTEPVELHSLHSDWSIPIEGLECEWDPDGTAPQAYLCNGVSVQANSVKNPKDSDESLRRAVRANLLADPTHDLIMDAGDASVVAMPQYSSVAMSVRASGEYGGEEQQILLYGEADALLPIAQQIWDSIADEPMPIDLQDTFVIDQPVYNAESALELSRVEKKIEQVNA